VTNVREYTRLGFYPNVNIGYGIRMFGVHDPIVPAGYFTSWPIPAAAPEAHGVSLFVPAITSAGLARRYGISYVLVGGSTPPPSGMVKVTTLDGEALYRVPSSSQFQLIGGGKSSVSIDDGAVDGSYRLHYIARKSGTLVMRVTAVPGWHASIDGHPIILSTYSGIMESAHVPAGQHVVTLHYWPKRFSYGILLAVLSLASLVLGGLASWFFRRRKQRRIAVIAT